LRRYRDRKTQANKIAERESQERPKRSRLASGLMVAKLLLRNPGILKKVLVMGPDEPHAML
jgi:hypothetical protein